MWTIVVSVAIGILALIANVVIALPCSCSETGDDQSKPGMLPFGGPLGPMPIGPMPFGPMPFGPFLMMMPGPIPAVPFPLGSPMMLPNFGNGIQSTPNIFPPMTLPFIGKPSMPILNSQTSSHTTETKTTQEPTENANHQQHNLASVNTALGTKDSSRSLDKVLSIALDKLAGLEVDKKLHIGDLLNNFHQSHSHHKHDYGLELSQVHTGKHDHDHKKDNNENDYVLELIGNEQHNGEDALINLDLSDGHHKKNYGLELDLENTGKLARNHEHRTHHDGSNYKLELIDDDQIDGDGSLVNLDLSHHKGDYGLVIGNSENHDHEHRKQSNKGDYILQVVGDNHKNGDGDLINLDLSDSHYKKGHGLEIDLENTMMNEHEHKSHHAGSNYKLELIDDDQIDEDSSLVNLNLAHAHGGKGGYGLELALENSGKHNHNYDHRKQSNKGDYVLDFIDDDQDNGDGGLINLDLSDGHHKRGFDLEFDRGSSGNHLPSYIPIKSHNGNDYELELISDDQENGDGDLLNLDLSHDQHRRQYGLELDLENAGKHNLEQNGKLHLSTNGDKKGVDTFTLDLSQNRHRGIFGLDIDSKTKKSDRKFKNHHHEFIRGHGEGQEDGGDGMVNLDSSNDHHRQGFGFNLDFEKSDQLGHKFEYRRHSHQREHGDGEYGKGVGLDFDLEKSKRHDHKFAQRHHEFENEHGEDVDLSINGDGQQEGGDSLINLDLSHHRRRGRFDLDLDLENSKTHEHKLNIDSSNDHHRQGFGFNLDFGKSDQLGHKFEYRRHSHKREHGDGEYGKGVGLDFDLEKSKRHDHKFAQRHHEFENEHGEDVDLSINGDGQQEGGDSLINLDLSHHRRRGRFDLDLDLENSKTHEHKFKHRRHEFSRGHGEGEIDTLIGGNLHEHGGDGLANLDLSNDHHRSGFGIKFEHGRHGNMRGHGEIGLSNDDLQQERGDSLINFGLQHNRRRGEFDLNDLENSNTHEHKFEHRHHKFSRRHGEGEKDKSIGADFQEHGDKGLIDMDLPKDYHQRGFGINFDLDKSGKHGYKFEHHRNGIRSGHGQGELDLSINDNRQEEGGDGSITLELSGKNRRELDLAKSAKHSTNFEHRRNAFRNGHGEGVELNINGNRPEGDSFISIQSSNDHHRGGINLDLAKSGEHGYKFDHHSHGYKMGHADGELDLFMNGNRQEDTGASLINLDLPHDQREGFGLNLDIGKSGGHHNHELRREHGNGHLAISILGNHKEESGDGHGEQSGNDYQLEHVDIGKPSGGNGQINIKLPNGNNKEDFGINIDMGKPAKQNHHSEHHHYEYKMEPVSGATINNGKLIDIDLGLGRNRHDIGISGDIGVDRTKLLDLNLETVKGGFVSNHNGFKVDGVNRHDDSDNLVKLNLHLGDRNKGNKGFLDSMT